MGQTSTGMEKLKRNAPGNLLTENAQYGCTTTATTTATADLTAEIGSGPTTALADPSDLCVAHKTARNPPPTRMAKTMDATTTSLEQASIRLRVLKFAWQSEPNTLLWSLSVSSTNGVILPSALLVSLVLLRPLEDEIAALRKPLRCCTHQQR